MKIRREIDDSSSDPIAEALVASEAASGGNQNLYSDYTYRRPSENGLTGAYSNAYLTHSRAGGYGGGGGKGHGGGCCCCDSGSSGGSMMDALGGLGDTGLLAAGAAAVALLYTAITMGRRRRKRSTDGAEMWTDADEMGETAAFTMTDMAMETLWQGKNKFFTRFYIQSNFLEDMLPCHGRFL
jgi:hypothetical protein